MVFLNCFLPYFAGLTTLLGRRARGDLIKTFKILNGFSNFRNTLVEDFIIGNESNAINKAKATNYNLDILGVNRSLAPDIGAYQAIDFD